MTTPMGAKAVVHGAAVYYPLSAFDPGVTVVLTAIPVSGARIVKNFTDTELRRIQ